MDFSYKSILAGSLPLLSRVSSGFIPLLSRSHPPPGVSLTVEWTYISILPWSPFSLTSRSPFLFHLEPLSLKLIEFVPPAGLSRNRDSISQTEFIPTHFHLLRRIFGIYEQVILFVHSNSTYSGCWTLERNLSTIHATEMLPNSMKFVLV